MKLFLASEATHPTTLQDLKKFVGGFEGKRIVYIPTAANGDLYGSWKNGDSLKRVQSLGATVDIIELESTTQRDVIKSIGQPDILWFAGGMPGYLLYWIRRVGLEKVLPVLLAKGTIYVGSSAGSMICSLDQSLSEWYIGETEPGASLLPGLGLTDFIIYPHYEEHLLKEITQRFTKGKLYLLKNGETITKVNTTISILGAERIIKK